MRKEYKIKGLDCANCAAKLESGLNKIKDYDDVVVNFMNQKLIIEAKKEWDEEKLKKDIENINFVVSIEPILKNTHHPEYGEECGCGHEHHHHHEHKHEHGEECGCGHEHHHEHKHEHGEECSCGHEHHHEHKHEHGEECGCGHEHHHHHEHKHEHGEECGGGYEHHHHHEHKHEHGEECSCGHEHHHEHKHEHGEECSCGHEHHHEHKHEHEHGEECSCGHEHHHEHKHQHEHGEECGCGHDHSDVHASHHHHDESTRIFLLDGIDCANCAAKVEERVGKLDGVREASVNFMQKKLYLKSDRDDLVAEIQKICNGVESGMKVSEIVKHKPDQIFVIEGLDCANCAAKVEAAVGKLEGVTNASLNFMQKKLYITSQKKFTVEEIQEAARMTEPDVVVHLEHQVVEEVVEAKKKNYLPLVLFVIALIGIFATNGLSIQWVFYYFAYFVVGYKVLKTALNNMMHGQWFDENFLMALATVGALIIQEYPEAIAVMVFYQIGEYFQGKAVDSSRRSIASLMDIRPDFARVLRNGSFMEVNPEEVNVGDIIEIRPGERVPMDSVVIEGESTMDTFSITGESVGRRVQKGSELISGFVNKVSSIEAKVTHEYAQSAVSRILEMVENATNRKAKTERFITKFAKIYTPIVVALGFIIALVVPTIFKLDYATWIYRGMIFLVVSCPCALVLSVPLGYFAGIGAGSKKGILIKGSNYLEALEKVDTIVCDKTGTLTKGNFKVVEVSAFDDTMMDQVAIAEAHSHHPIAISILDFYNKKPDASRMTKMEELAGMGIHAVIDGHDVYVGNSRLMEHQHIQFTEVDRYGSIVYVASDDKYLGHIVVADEIKPETKQAVSDLKALGMKVVMLTGDIKDTALEVANQCGIQEVRYELLPDQKVEAVEALGENVAFIGDGINDAPVLARSSVGISMGGLGSDAAIEASDIVLMDDRLDKVAQSIRLARYTKKIIMQNIVFSLGIKIFVMILSILGKSSMWLGVFADVGVAIIAVLNSLRILKFEK